MYDGEFYWSSVQQGYILGGFSYGYVCTQILGGILAERYGGKWVIGLGTFLSTAAGQVQLSNTYTNTIKVIIFTDCYHQLQPG